MYETMLDTIGLVAKTDPELAAAMNRELVRQRQNIELIASENIVSPAVMAAMGSVLTNKYAEGYPGKRYYGGCMFVDEVEQLAIDRACRLFGSRYANVQPHSGAQANIAVYFALLEPGDTVMGMDLSQGGHLTHGSPVNLSGKYFHFVSYGVDEDGYIDYEAVRRQAEEVRPKMIVAGASAYPRAIKFDILADDTDVNLLIEERVMSYLGYDYEEYYLKDMKIPDNLDYDKMYSGILKKLKAEAESNVNEQEQMLADYNADPDSFKVSKTAKHSYDRDKAVAYSYKWVNGESVVRNPAYSDYAVYGGNCQNYVSQSLFASGIPMDWSGSEQWKWFDDESDLSELPSGRSGSWSGTEYFYEYCNKNTGKGIVAETDGNIFSAQPGDVIQYVVDGWAHHSVIVTKVIYDDDGNVADLLINSNTTDRVDYPMSAYGYTDIRLIKIIGYNDK